MFAFFFSLPGGPKEQGVPEQLLGFLVLGRGGRSRKPLSKGHLISWNNMDSITEWLCRQIHPFKHKHTPVPQACRELKYQAEIPLSSSF